MNRCDTCGNEYDRAFQVTTIDGERYTFDCVECAAHRLAPACHHCDCRILGHGIQAEHRIYCCASCARSDGVPAARDRVGAEA